MVREISDYRPNAYAAEVYFQLGSYKPTWVELTLTAGTFGYCFAVLHFTRLFPIIAVWEYKEGLPPSTASRQLSVSPKLDLKAREQDGFPWIEVFDTRAEAVAVLRELQRQGVPSSSITVMFRAIASESNDARRLNSGFAIAGGLLGGVRDSVDRLDITSRWARDRGCRLCRGLFE